MCYSFGVSVGCVWADYTCPTRVEDFELVLAHKFRHCAYSSSGFLLSTNVPDLEGANGENAANRAIHENLLEITQSALALSSTPSPPPPPGSAPNSSGVVVGNISVCDLKLGEPTCRAETGCRQHSVGRLLDTSAESQPAARCATLVMEKEPSANAASYASDGRCYADFGATLHDTSYDGGTLMWQGCFLTPTDDIVGLILSVGLGNVTVPARCRLELHKLQVQRVRARNVCTAIVSSTLGVFNIFFAIVTYHWARFFFSLHVTHSAEATLVDGASGGGGSGGRGGIAAHHQLDDSMFLEENAAFDTALQSGAPPLLPTPTQPNRPTAGPRTPAGRGIVVNSRELEPEPEPQADDGASSRWKRPTTPEPPPNGFARSEDFDPRRFETPPQLHPDDMSSARYRSHQKSGDGVHPPEFRP